MKKTYQKPSIHFVSHSGNLTNEEIASMSEEELAEYLKKVRLTKNAKLYKVNEDYLLREIAGEFVLVPVGSGAEQVNGMLALNETFYFLWNQFQEPHTIYDVVLEARKEFHDTKEKIEKDIHNFVDECLKYGFLKEEEV
jgi:hypothetical protein